MAKFVSTTFDYSAIEDADDKGKLLSLEGRIKKHLVGAGSSMLEVGRDLKVAKESAKKHFGKWVKTVFGFTPRTAENYMNAFDKFGECEIDFALQDTAMILLAAPSTPKAAISEAKKLADNGVVVSSTVAKAIIKKHKPPKEESNGHAKPDEEPEEPVEPPECEVSKGDHEWEADGSGERFCVHCKEDHPDNPKPVFDGLDAKVPDELRDVFEQCTPFQEAMNAASQLKKAVHAIAEHPAGGWLDLTETDRLITQVRNNLKYAMPFTECPKCRRKATKKCTHCKGTGWLNQIGFKTCATDEDKEWLESRKS